VRQRSGAEPNGDVRLVHQVRFGAGHRDHVTVDLDLVQRRERRNAGVDNQRFSDASGALVVGVAELVAEGDILVEVMLEADRADVHLGAEEVVVGKPVEVLPLDWGWCSEQPGQAVIRYVVLLQVEEVDVEPCVGAQAEGERRSDAETAILAGVAFGYAVEVAHQVQSERRAVQALDRLVDISGEPIGAVGSDRGGQVLDRRQLWLLADLVDHAAGGTAAKQDRGRSFQHLDVLQVERIAIVAAEVANPVEVEVVAGREATQCQVVAL